MQFNNMQLKVAEIKAKYPEGAKLQLQKINNSYNYSRNVIPSKTLGTIDFVDDSGLIYVKFDNGKNAVIVTNIDKFEIYEDEV